MEQENLPRFEGLKRVQLNGGCRGGAVASTAESVRESDAVMESKVVNVKTELSPHKRRPELPGTTPHRIVA